VRIAYCVTTWSGAKLQETISHIPKGWRLLVVDTSQHGWPLARAWNYGIDRLCIQEGYDVVIVMNDDIVLRQDTGRLLADGLLLKQYEQGYQPELLLVSARHAAPSDARTDEPDWALLEAAEPQLQPGPDFACFATTRRLFDLVGRFDEGFNPCWFEDNDMHRRIQLAGYEAGAYAPYWHYLNGTLRSDPERRAQVEGGAFERSKAHYVDKWGGIPGQERYATPYNEPAMVPA
jgi:hypothetical protein